MKKIILHTASTKLIGGRPVFADAGETLTVGEHIDADRAKKLVNRGGAVVIDPLDHDRNGRKGGAASAVSEGEAN